VRKNGIYICTHCDLFQTGSRVALNVHLRSAHGIDASGAAVTTEPLRVVRPPKPVQEEKVEDTPAEPAKPVEEEPVPSEVAPDSDEDVSDRGTEDVGETPVVEDEDSGVSISTGSEPIEEESPDEAFRCPLCTKEFKSEHGLKIHMSRMHKGEDE
jgi:hypothetical protein